MPVPQTENEAPDRPTYPIRTRWPKQVHTLAHQFERVAGSRVGLGVVGSYARRATGLEIARRHAPYEHWGFLGLRDAVAQAADGLLSICCRRAIQRRAGLATLALGDQVDVCLEGGNQVS